MFALPAPPLSHAIPFSRFFRLFGRQMCTPFPLALFSSSLSFFFAHHACKLAFFPLLSFTLTGSLMPWPPSLSLSRLPFPLWLSIPLLLNIPFPPLPSPSCLVTKHRSCLLFLPFLCFVCTLNRSFIFRRQVRNGPTDDTHSRCGEEKKCVVGQSFLTSTQGAFMLSCHCRLPSSFPPTYPLRVTLGQLSRHAFSPPLLVWLPPCCWCRVWRKSMKK